MTSGLRWSGGRHMRVVAGPPPPRLFTHALLPAPEEAAEELEGRLLGDVEEQQPCHKRHALAIPHL